MAVSDERSEVPWGPLYRHRLDIRRDLGSIWDLPILKRYLDRIRALLPGRNCVLEVGAGNRGLGERLLKEFPSVVYRSMDVDRTYRHDYYSLDEVGEQFDLVIMIEVIEHLTLDEGVALLTKARRLLNPGGVVLLTTPNVFHPTRYWADCTHRTFYPYDDLAGILRWIGYVDVRAFRVYNAPFFSRWLTIHAVRHVHRYLGIDFALSILVEGRAPSPS